MQISPLHGSFLHPKGCKFQPFMVHFCTQRGSFCYPSGFNYATNGVQFRTHCGLFLRPNGSNFEPFKGTFCNPHGLISAPYGVQIWTLVAYFLTFDNPHSHSYPAFTTHSKIWDIYIKEHMNTFISMNGIYGVVHFIWIKVSENQPTFNKKNIHVW